ncbi:MAG: hypothetical protein HQK50_07670 [Oligoflexia bacterium]|nr:hypothetical protein [Oligoflexia bacterium]MBF0365434.1 hypothetical protein [Oligoflexia bacterium]
MFMFLKKTVPFLITLGMGIYTFAYYFMPHRAMQNIWDQLSNWAIIVGGGSMAVGIVSMFRTYYKRSMNRADPNRYYCMITLVCMVGMAVIGFVTGIGDGTLFNDLFLNVMLPLESTMFSLLAFYIASAAFRSFRLKTFSAGLLLFAAVVVMLAQIPAGENISKQIPVIAAWINEYPNVAAQRAIMIGIAIGSVATALKIILGIDKSVFSGAGKV